MGGAESGVLGIDVGATKAAAGIIDPATGAIVLRDGIPPSRCAELRRF